MFVKICGITNLEDAILSVESGADAIGLVFAESPRRVEPDIAQKIAKAVKDKIMLVGVFCDMKLENVREISETCMLDFLQFHGHESPAYCSMFGKMVIKTIRFKSREDLSSINSYDTKMVLVDSAVSGTTYDWSVLKEYKFYDKKLIIAGGLNPDNVATAIKQVMPFGVDSSSGVEACIGKKDPMKVREFIARAKAAIKEKR